MYELLQELCKEKGTNITNLCVTITGSSGNLPTWKKGNINPESLRKIADYFNVSADYLLGRADNSQGYSNNNISNSTNIAFGEHSSVKTNNDGIMKETNKIVEKIIIKKYDYSNGDNVRCPFCDANVSKIIGDTVIEIIVSPTECYQLLPKPFTPVNPVGIDNTYRYRKCIYK